MALTLNDWLLLIGLLSASAVVTYSINEVGCAIWSYLD